MDIGAHSVQGDNTASKCLETYIQMLSAFLKRYINGISTRREVRDHKHRYFIKYKAVEYKAVV